MWSCLQAAVIVFGVHQATSQFLQCHDDPSLDPDEGPLRDMQFTWLGTLQYIHVKNGTPHFFRVPRVLLISRQFVLATAVDAAQVPDGYALGNVAFGEYERDEVECGVTRESLSAGAECRAAALLVPLADVLLHPEYKHFGVADSIALLKLLTAVKSQYMVPACLPFKDFLVTRTGKQTSDKIYHVDFINDVPRDIISEEKEVTKLSLLPKELCFLYGASVNANLNKTNPSKSRIICSTGCGFHSGAPSIVHEHTGHWSLVAIAQGGSPCPDPLRSRRPPPPPRHIALRPYVPWITAAITGRALTAFAKDDPFGFIMARTIFAKSYDLFGHGWNGHWWMGGMACYNRGAAADNMFKFYHEIFQVKPTGHTNVNYYLEIYAPHSATIICVKVGMPYQLARPKVWDLDTSETKVRIPVLQFQHLYKMQVEAYAYNTTESDESDESSEEEDDYDT